MKTLNHHIPETTLPIVAILRGTPLQAAIPITERILAAGIELIEITMNTEDALNIIAALAKHFGTKIILGAGTVMSETAVHAVADAGGRFIVSPHTAAAVIKTTKQRQLMSIAGTSTPTEMFAALDAGADMLKIFPCFVLGPKGIRSVRAVLPPLTPVIPTGGVFIPQSTYTALGSSPPPSAVADDDPNSIAAYMDAGCWGIGLVNNLYTPATSLAELSANAQAGVAAFKAATSNSARN